jgi:hypothetical protein
VINLRARVTLLLLAVFPLIWLAQVRAQSPTLSSQGPAPLFQIAGIAFGLDPALLEAIAAVESGGRVNAVSPKGASGLMQLMPDTARRFGVRDPFDPVESVVGTARLLVYLQQYAGIEDLPELLAAYNAGEGAVERYRGIPPYAETHDYVRRVLLAYLLNGEPLPSHIVRSRPQSGLLDSESRERSLDQTGSLTRMVWRRPGLDQASLRAAKTVRPFTDADVLAKLQQIKQARNGAVLHQRELDQQP